MYLGRVLLVARTVPPTSRYLLPDKLYCLAVLAGLLNMVAHMITKTASDPLINAWYEDITFYENADLCAWQFGTIYTVVGSGKKYNLRDVNGNYYFLQMNLDPRYGTCITGV